MPRDANGNYTLPAGNPVISGTTIDTTWANPTMNDLAIAITDSLSRTGEGGMLVPFLFPDGAVATPGMSWTNETTTGFYRAGASDMRVSVGAVDRFRWTATSVQVWNSVDLIWEDVAANTGGFLPLTGGTLTNEGEILTLKDSVNIGINTYAYASFRSADDTEMGTVGISNLGAEALRVIATVSSLELTSTTSGVNLNGTTSINLNAPTTNVNGGVAVNYTSIVPLALVTTTGTNAIRYQNSASSMYSGSFGTSYVISDQANLSNQLIDVSTARINLNVPVTNVNSQLFVRNPNTNTATIANNVGIATTAGLTLEVSGHNSFAIVCDSAGEFSLSGDFNGVAKYFTVNKAGTVAANGDITAFQGLPNEISMSQLAGINGAISTVDGSILSGTGFTTSFTSAGKVAVIFTTPKANANYQITLGSNIVNVIWALKTVSGFNIETYNGAGSPASALADFTVTG